MGTNSHNQSNSYASQHRVGNVVTTPNESVGETSTIECKKGKKNRDTKFGNILVKFL